MTDKRMIVAKTRCPRAVWDDADIFQLVLRILL